MATTPNDPRGELIRAQLAATRWAIAAHRDDARRRVHELKDWRTHVREHPWLLSGLGVGAVASLGAVLAASRWGTPSGARLAKGFWSKSEPVATPGRAGVGGLVTGILMSTAGRSLAMNLARRAGMQASAVLLPIIMRKLGFRNPFGGDPESWPDRGPQPRAANALPAEPRI